MCSCGGDHEYVVSGRHVYAGGSDELTVTRRDGYVRTCSIGHPTGANVFPGGQWANAGKTHVPGNYAGVPSRR